MISTGCLTIWSAGERPACPLPEFRSGQVPPDIPPTAAAHVQVISGSPLTRMEEQFNYLDHAQRIIPAIHGPAREPAQGHLGDDPGRVQGPRAEGVVDP